MANELELIKGRPVSYVLSSVSDLTDYTLRACLRDSVNRVVGVYELGDGIEAVDDGFLLTLPALDTAKLSTESGALHPTNGQL